MRSHCFRTSFAPGSNEQSMRGELKTIAPLIACEQTANREPTGITSEWRSAGSFGGTVRRRPLAPILVLAVLCYAFPARAAETTPIECGVNEDRVWVYDSLDSFDVALKLKCGEQVEIIGREKGYVKIRTSSGKEGYVPEKALPQPLEREGNNQNSSEAQAGRQDGPQSVAAAAAHAKTSSSSATGPAAKPVEHPATSVSQTSPMAGPPAPARESGEVASSTVQTSASPAETNSSTAAAKDASNQEKTKPQPIPAHPQAKPATYSAAHSTTRPSDSANAGSKTASAGQSKTKSPPTNAAAASTKGTAGKTSSTKSVSVSNATVAAPAPASTAPSKIELASNLPSGSPASSNGSVHAVASPRDPDEEEEPVVKPIENNEACRIYFSAYGLSPSQYKWMSRNRGKSFPGICPAPAPAMVDFVVIFTHDADFYNGTMPTPIHTDKNGFSDFTPLTTVDSAVVSPSEADKNRREYVWVFHTKRGTFDPAKFSPKRRPLFSTAESNKFGTAAGGRSAEDALRFIEQHGVDR
jgi:uncharacterized protein YgiM (DUF1202 family)